ncbi:uncharacterized protein C8Q71DRAFT_727151 [Rhodofomes roseus]|uniref:Arrestin-like N-terminal domain-containing protein n=1 Tax=Rhodofomes roseus TaxID=34475 RepID=A0ABQ8K316_9APHY|nr:uncharacterized protein C8Q71DRAFT_727151 [Rhodofomes roseus]KAH9830958.1 hypothetical protein C8Q71DRAFT_727151 [Rhodofomes roseus]
MFFAFSSGKTCRPPAQSPIIQAYHDGHQATRPGVPSTTVFITNPLQPTTRTHTTYQPAYTVEIDVFVEPAPDPDDEDRRETWIVDRQPHRQLARGHVVTLRTENHVIESGRLSKVVTLMRHWVTFKITGSKAGLQIRVPIPWAHLCDLDGYSHTVLYRTLPMTPAPHHTFLNKPAFQNTDSNPYEFDIKPSSMTPRYDYTKKTLAEVPSTEGSSVTTTTSETSPTTGCVSNRLADVNASLAPSQFGDARRERPENPTNLLLVLAQAVDGVSQVIEVVGQAAILRHIQWVELVRDRSQRLVNSLAMQDGLLGPGDGRIGCAQRVVRQLVALEDLVDVVHDLDDVVEGVRRWDGVRVIGDRLAVGLEETALEKPKTYEHPTNAVGPRQPFAPRYGQETWLYGGLTLDDFDQAVVAGDVSFRGRFDAYVGHGGVGEESARQPRSYGRGATASQVPFGRLPGANHVQQGPKSYAMLAHSALFYPVYTAGRAPSNTRYPYPLNLSVRLPRLVVKSSIRSVRDRGLLVSKRPLPCRRSRSGLCEALPTSLLPLSTIVPSRYTLLATRSRISLLALRRRLRARMAKNPRTKELMAALPGGDGNDVAGMGNTP